MRTSTILLILVLLLAGWLWLRSYSVTPLTATLAGRRGSSLRADPEPPPRVGPASGVELWHVAFDGSDTTGPALAPDGTIHVAVPEALRPNPDFPQTPWLWPLHAQRSRLYAIDNHGRIAWQRALDGVVSGPPAVGADGTVYVFANIVDDPLFPISLADRDRLPDTPGVLYAIDRIGLLKWTFTGQPSYSCAPVLGPDDTVYVACANGKLYAIDTLTGELRWISEFLSSRGFRSSLPLDSAPRLDSQGRVLMSIRSDVLCIGSGGEPAWSAMNSSWRWVEPGPQTPLPGRGAELYVADADCGVEVLSSEGELMGRLPTYGRVTALATDGGGSVVWCVDSLPAGSRYWRSGRPSYDFAAGVDPEDRQVEMGCLYVFSAEHELQWGRRFEKSFSCCLLVDDVGNCYLSNAEGQDRVYYSFDREGNERWRLTNATAEATQTVLSESGVLYVTDGEKLVAIGDAP